MQEEERGLQEQQPEAELGQLLATSSSVPVACKYYVCLAKGASELCRGRVAEQRADSCLLSPATPNTSATQFFLW